MLFFACSDRKPYITNKGRIGHDEKTWLLNNSFHPNKKCIEHRKAINEKKAPSHINRDGAFCGFITYNCFRLNGKCMFFYKKMLHIHHNPAYCVTTILTILSIAGDMPAC